MIPELIEELTSDPGFILILHGPNDDMSGPNFVVEWGNEYDPEFCKPFYGETMLECLEKANAFRVDMEQPC